MTKQTRRRFSPEYKDQSVARLSEPGATHSSVAAELGVTPTQLKTWRLELEAAGSSSFRCKAPAVRSPSAHSAMTASIPVPAEGSSTVSPGRTAAACNAA